MQYRRTLGENDTPADLPSLPVVAQIKTNCGNVILLHCDIPRFIDATIFAISNIKYQL